MKFKKISTLLAVAVVSTSLVACSSPAESNKTENKKTTTITATDANGADIEIEFPENPERIVVLNLQTLDFLDAMGMGDKIVGLIKSTTFPEHLKKYAQDDSIVDVGSMKDIDMEAVMSLEPDAIFSSDRTKEMYNEFSMIAPTYAAYVDYTEGFMDGYKDLAEDHSEIFGIDDKVDDIIDGYEDRIDAIEDFAEDKTALLGIFAGGLNTLGNEGRASIVVNEMGFENLAGGKDVNHGNASSYEAWLQMNPDYMFILDKDSAVGTEGSTAAKEQMEKNNPVIAQTNAFKNGNIIYLEPGAAWYLADGGITSLDLMIESVEKGLGLK